MHPHTHRRAHVLFSVSRWRLELRINPLSGELLARSPAFDHARSRASCSPPILPTLRDFFKLAASAFALLCTCRARVREVGYRPPKLRQVPFLCVATLVLAIAYVPPKVALTRRLSPDLPLARFHPKNARWKGQRAPSKVYPAASGALGKACSNQRSVMLPLRLLPISAFPHFVEDWTENELQARPAI